MPFYDITKKQRVLAIETIDSSINAGLKSGDHVYMIQYSSDPDTYTRESVYLVTGRIYS